MIMHMKKSKKATEIIVNLASWKRFYSDKMWPYCYDSHVLFELKSLAQSVLIVKGRVFHFVKNTPVPSKDQNKESCSQRQEHENVDGITEKMRRIQNIVDSKEGGRDYHGRDDDYRN